MERYEQENRRSFRNDTTFASSTLRSSQQSRTQPQTKAGHSHVARRSRVDERPTSDDFFAAPKTRKRVKDASSSDSEDELLIASKPLLHSSKPKPKPAVRTREESTDATKSSSQKLTKAKAQSSSQKSNGNVSSSPPKRTPAAFPMDLSTLKSSPPKQKDEAAKYLSSFLSEKQQSTRSAPGNKQANNKASISKSASKAPANTKVANGSRKPSKSVKVIVSDDEELQSSSEEMRTETKSRHISKKLKPKPFPMDLSSLPSLSGTLSSNGSLPLRRRRSLSLSSTSTMSLGRPSTKSLHSSDPMDYSSDSSEQEPQYSKSYTQRIKEYDVDPKKLCPFCDTRLPDKPSDILIKMLEEIKPKATPDPRWANSLGLKADMSIYISYCARHTAESKELPKGSKYGWPTTLNANALAKRVRNLEQALRVIINDSGEGCFFQPLAETAFKYGKGSVTGAKGSWLTFDTASTGYYGEQGLAVITQVLFDLFSDLPEDKIYPLDPNTYRSLVLVPETALLLIQEDLQKKHGPDQDIPRTLALKVLRKSHKYGLAVFPVEDGDSFVAGDALARNRARKNKIIVESTSPKREEVKEAKVNKTRRLSVSEPVDLSSSDDDPRKMDGIKTVKKRQKIEPSAKSAIAIKSVLDNKGNSVERVKRKKIELKDRPATFQLHADHKGRSESFGWLINS